MKGSNIWNKERVYQEGDKLDITIFDLDVHHHTQIASALACLCDIPGSWSHSYSDCRGVCKAEYRFDVGERGRLPDLFAWIEYGEKLEFTAFGRGHLREEVCFYPELCLVGVEEYAILPDGMELVIRCPGIIYHNGKWCAPTEHLTYRDHAVWCDTIFKGEQK